MSYRRDSKHRVLRRGESIWTDGKYQFKYHIKGKPHFVYSWRLEPTYKLPAGKKPCLSLRELEKQIGYDLDTLMDPVGKNITVEELQQDGRGSSIIKTVRGVLHPAFQMAVDDDELHKNPFSFELATVIFNDSVTREAITKDQMRKFLKFVHDDNVYCKYYEMVYILFHTGMRISEFCGLTLKDIDLENRIINIDHQLMRTSNMKLIIESTKTNAGTRKLPMTEDVFRCFQAIIEDRETPRYEKMVDGHTGFLFLDKDGLPFVAMHWEHRFNHMVKRYNDIFRVQMPNITPHICRHTYCSNMAKARMNPKTLQYLMGHSDIGVTLNTYTHLGLDDAADELKRMEELKNARKELDKAAGEKPMSQKMFRAI